ncbi:unnamed protein product, partial [Staurois parvus]
VEASRRIGREGWRTLSGRIGREGWRTLSGRIGREGWRTLSGGQWRDWQRGVADTGRSSVLERLSLRKWSD